MATPERPTYNPNLRLRDIHPLTDALRKEDLSGISGALKIKDKSLPDALKTIVPEHNKREAIMARMVDAGFNTESQPPAEPEVLGKPLEGARSL